MKINVSKLLGDFTNGVKKHGPEILTGIGIAGMGTTVVLAVKATPKALILLDEKKQEEELDKLAPIDYIKTAWKCYIPAAITGTMSILCLVGASSVSARRNAAMAAAYTLSETAIREYKDKVVEVVGEKKEKEVREAVAKERIDNNPVTKQEVIVTGNGDVLCFDILSGRYFYSNSDKVNKAINNLNERMLNYSYVSMNEWFYELGLENTKLGNALGWNIDKGQIRIDFSTQLSEESTPCLVLDYDRMPVYDFDRWM